MKKDDYIPDPYEAVADAIIIRAVTDYRRARNIQRIFPRNREAKKTEIDCEAFFCSEWLKVLTRADGNDLLKRLKNEITDTVHRDGGNL